MMDVLGPAESAVKKRGKRSKKYPDTAVSAVKKRGKRSKKYPDTAVSAVKKRGKRSKQDRDTAVSAVSAVKKRRKPKKNTLRTVEAPMFESPVNLDAPLLPPFPQGTYTGNRRK